MTEKISGKSVKWPKPDFEKKTLGLCEFKKKIKIGSG